jgi:hypothetical protein
MLVKVAQNIQLPHKLPFKGVLYLFKPTCEIPNEIAEKIIANAPTRYSKVGKDEKIVAKEWTWREDFKNATVTNKFNALSEAGKVQVMELIDSLLNPEVLAKSASEKELAKAQAEKDKAAAKAKKEAAPAPAPAADAKDE